MSALVYRGSGQPARRPLISSAVVALTLLLAAGCGRGRSAAPPGAPPPAEPMPPPTPLYYDNTGGIRDSVRAVVRNATELGDYWRRATSMQASPAAVEPIDFNRDMVIIVGAGRKTAEEQIHVDSLLVRRELMPSGRREETLTIVVRSVVGCGRFRSEAFPLEIVRARKFEGPIKWEERIMRATCDESTLRP